MSEILVISDDPIDGLFIEKVLSEKRGDRVKALSFSQQILAEIDGALPDLIIIRFFSTEYNSIEIFQSIRENSTSQNIPVLFWQVSYLRQGVKDIQQLGVAGCLEIPVTPEQLVNARDTVLSGGNYYPRL